MDKQQLIDSIKEWWKTTAKRDAAQISVLINSGIAIGGNEFKVNTSPHRTWIYANDLPLIDVGYSDNERDLIQNIITRLNSQNGGRRKYKTISNKQRKKSIKYRKKQKTNRR